MLATDIDTAPRRLSLTTLAEEHNHHHLFGLPMTSTAFGEAEPLPWGEAPSCHRQFIGVAHNNLFTAKARAHSISQDAAVLDSAACSWLDAFGEDLREANRLLCPAPGSEAVVKCEEDMAPSIVKQEADGPRQHHAFAEDQFEETFHLLCTPDHVSPFSMPDQASTTSSNKRKVPDSPDSDSDSQSGKKSKSPTGEARMQEVAREGQKHWGHKVQQMRQEWADLCMWQKNPHFATQISMCARLHIKSQHECILRQLQLAAVDGVIRPAPFSNDETNSFMGWTGFEIVQNRAKEFRRRIEGMFQTPPNHKTLNNTMRRAGLVPEYCWGEAWSGAGRFVYDKEKRAHYSAKA